MLTNIHDIVEIKQFSSCDTLKMPKTTITNINNLLNSGWVLIDTHSAIRSRDDYSCVMTLGKLREIKNKELS